MKNAEKLNKEKNRHIFLAIIIILVFSAAFLFSGWESRMPDKKEKNSYIQAGMKAKFDEIYKKSEPRDFMGWIEIESAFMNGKEFYPKSKNVSVRDIHDAALEGRLYMEYLKKEFEKKEKND
jgi:hypothetical protein